jgi:hypothetical protein
MLGEAGSMLTTSTVFSASGPLRPPASTSLEKAGPGVDVVITIFGDFRQFSAKEMAFFSKTNVMIKILHNLALFCVKNANFLAEIFGENI